MKLPVSIAQRAELDLAHQYRWYQDHAGAEVAEEFLSVFEKTVAWLAEQPDMGKRRRFRARELAGIRSIGISRPFAVHLLFYRADSETLSIERVMHGARDLPRRLLEPPG